MHASESEPSSFKHLTDESLHDLLPFLKQVGQIHDFVAGDHLITQGHSDQQIYCLLDGAVEVLRDGQKIGLVEAGDLVGEYAFIDNRPRTASVVVVQDVTALVIERQGLLECASEDLSSVTRFLQLATRRMEERAKELQPQDTDGFVDRISSEAISHHAVNHPYLEALASGDLPDLRWALSDFGRHYYGYSAHFPRYLTQTISRLSEPRHRNGLLENLTEESGQYEDEELHELEEAGIAADWIVGVPHPELFKRFCDALKIQVGAVHEDNLEVVCWREMFLDVLVSGSPAQAIGALGLGTENIVSTMYRHFLPALDRVGIEPRDAVFFPLHALVDDHHQATLRDIARDFAGTADGRHDLIKGMRKALYLRAGFWDWLYNRARNPHQVEASTV